MVVRFVIGLWLRLRRRRRLRVLYLLRKIFRSFSRNILVVRFFGGYGEEVFNLVVFF